MRKSVRMKLVLSRELELLDFSDPKKERPVKAPPGEYAIERIRNPLGRELDWFIIAGTNIGAGVAYWEGLMILEDDVPPPEHASTKGFDTIDT